MSETKFLPTPVNARYDHDAGGIRRRRIVNVNETIVGVPGFSSSTDETLPVKCNTYTYVGQVGRITMYRYMRKDLCGILSTIIY